MVIMVVEEHSFLRCSRGRSIEGDQLAKREVMNCMWRRNVLCPIAVMTSNFLFLATLGLVDNMFSPKVVSYSFCRPAGPEPG
jgi:hypothetical protein